MTSDQPSIPARTGEDKYIQLNGLRFHYVTWGEPTLPPLVCLHGLRSYGRTFEPLAAALKDRFHVIALDQRGRGETDWDPARNYQTEQYVSDLAALVDALRFDTFHLLGHSMGGINALVYTLKHPGRLSSMILEDSGPGASVDSAGSARIRSELVSTPMRFDSWQQARVFWRSVRPNVTDAAIESRVANSLRASDSGIVWKHDQAGIAASWLDPHPVFSRPDLWPCVDAVACPALIVRGGRSDYLSKTTMDEMVRRNPRMTGVDIADAGHYVHDDQPERFIEAVKSFLAG